MSMCCWAVPIRRFATRQPDGRNKIPSAYSTVASVGLSEAKETPGTLPSEFATLSGRSFRGFSLQPRPPLPVGIVVAAVAAGQSSDAGKAVCVWGPPPNLLRSFDPSRNKLREGLLNVVFRMTARRLLCRGLAETRSCSDGYGLPSDAISDVVRTRSNTATSSRRPSQLESLSQRPPKKQLAGKEALLSTVVSNSGSNAPFR